MFCSNIYVLLLIQKTWVLLPTLVLVITGTEVVEVASVVVAATPEVVKAAVVVVLLEIETIALVTSNSTIGGGDRNSSHCSNTSGSLKELSVV